MKKTTIHVEEMNPDSPLFHKPTVTEILKGNLTSDTPVLPRKWDMLKNLVSAAKDAIASGLEVRTPEDTEKALKLCAECPNLAGDAEHPRCGICGCHLRAKVQLTGWHCPIGKW